MAENIQTWWDIDTYASKINVIEGTAGTKDAREYYEVHRRAVRSGNAMEWTRAKPTEQLKLTLGSALLTGVKITKGPKPEEFVSIVNRYRYRKGIRKDIGRIRSESIFGKERYMAHHPLLNTNKPGIVRRLCKVQRNMPERQTTCRTCSTARVDWNDIKILRRVVE